MCEGEDDERDDCEGDDSEGNDCEGVEESDGG